MHSVHSAWGIEFSSYLVRLSIFKFIELYINSISLDKLAMKIVQKTDKDKFIQFSKGSPTFHKHIQEQNDEAYELRVDAELQKISITSPTSHGAFNGLQSLLSLIDESVHSKEKSLHDVHIKDRPRFTYRGHMVDLSRNFHGKETIMELLDIMAMYKLNKLHLHLSDDDGWRLQIPQIPELTKVSPATLFVYIFQSGYNPKVVVTKD